MEILGKGVALPARCLTGRLCDGLSVGSTYESRKINLAPAPHVVVSDSVKSGGPVLGPGRISSPEARPVNRKIFTEIQQKRRVCEC
jgi:hypothetical protein